MADADKIKQLVFDAMDNAIENGEFDLIVKGEVERVATDLLDYDVAIGDYQANRTHDDRLWVADLIPHIQAWRAAHCDVCALPLSPQADACHHCG